MAAPKKTENRTLMINEPWKLAIPAEIFESIQAVSKLTGQSTEQLIAQTITHNWQRFEPKKKRARRSGLDCLSRWSYVLRDFPATKSRGGWSTKPVVQWAFGGSCVLPLQKRREVVQFLRDDRMGLREVAATVGLSKETVRQIRLATMPMEPARFDRTAALVAAQRSLRRDV